MLSTRKCVADLILNSISINKHGALVFVSIVSKIWDEKVYGHKENR